MSSEPEESETVADRPAGEYAVTTENTFEFMPGPLTGISCPNCFRDQLLKEIIRSGECTHCGTSLELTLKADTAD